MTLTLRDKIVKCLKEKPEQRFTVREIAEWIRDTYPEDFHKKQKRSKHFQAAVNSLDAEQATVNQYVSEIGRERPLLQKKHPEVKNTEDRPRKYYFTESTDSTEIGNAEGNEASPASKVNGSSTKEHDLYPILSEFLWSELGLYSKRIDEKRSHNTRGAGGNKWLHPDLVGLQDLGDDWHQETKECVTRYADKKTKLWSFEVKILINRSNVREVFFQAVSNSSWANFGYLVSSGITGSETMKELRILASLHGIGFILLDVENPPESQITIPAKERSEIDWDTANRLTKENEDFLEYIKLIRQFYQTGDLRSSDWDRTTTDQG